MRGGGKLNGIEGRGNLLVVGRLRVGGFDSVEFDVFDGLGNALLEGLEFGELPALFHDDLVELVVLMFEVGEVGLDLFKSLGKFFVHGTRLAQKGGLRREKPMNEQRRDQI
jgi:hypothetical protein